MPNAFSYSMDGSRGQDGKDREGMNDERSTPPDEDARGGQKKDDEESEG